LGRGDREHSTDHPIRTAPVPIETHKVNILILNLSEEVKNILHFKRLLDSLLLLACLGGCLLIALLTLLGKTIPLGYKAKNALVDELVGLKRTTAVLRLLTASLDLVAGLLDRCPTSLTPALGNVGMLILVNEEVATANTDTAQDTLDLLKELNKVDRASKSIMSEMAGTVMICLPTRATRLAIV
jgi:hypothetical protein